MSTYSENKPVTVPGIRSQKGIQKITALTAYDYPMARILDEAGIDMILVGDSLATVVYGETNTLSVTLEEMLRHTLVVARATKRALVIGDMPFMSYQVSEEQAVMAAGRFLKEAKAHAVKLEGGLEMASTIRAITRAGIPVLAHIGLTPQSIHAMGNYRMHGKSKAEQDYLIESANAVAEAGAFGVVLECVQPDLAKLITETVSIPTIGIGAGTDCDGQILVVHDLIGLTLGHVPKFAEPLASVKDQIREAATGYISRTRGADSSRRVLGGPHAIGN